LPCGHPRVSARELDQRGVDGLFSAGPVCLSDRELRVRLPRERTQVRIRRRKSRSRQIISCGPGPGEIFGLQTGARDADERVDAPVPVQEELRCLRRIADILEALTCAIVSPFAKRLKACRQLTDGFRLAGRIDAAVEQGLA